MTEVVIAGGGLAGGAAACVLARAGRQVLLFERQAQSSEKICGEFISAEAKHYLDRIGIDLVRLGAHRIDTVRLVHRSASVAVKLPFAGYGLSRRVLDDVLLREAARLGAEIRRGETVRLGEAHPLGLDLSSGGEVRPETLFLATGKHDLRGLRRAARPARNLVGFKLHLHLSGAQREALAAHVELILLKDGYAGLQMVDGGLANLCLLVADTRLAAAGGTWEGLLADLMQAEPHLRARLSGASPAYRPLSIYRVPYGFVHRPTAADPPGLFRLGDQMAVIPSFTGDGMSIALHSAVVAATSHLAGISAAVYHRRIGRDLRRQIGRATLLSRAADTAFGRAGALRLAALWPAGVRLAARLTRVPPATFAEIC
jgi:flavin-dependent dehydrogenase